MARKPSVGEKLASLADIVVDAAKKKRDPEFQIPVRSLSNVAFNPKKGIIELGKNKQTRAFFHLGMARRCLR